MTADVNNIHPVVTINCTIHCEKCCPRWLKMFSCCCPIFNKKDCNDCHAELNKKVELIEGEEKVKEIVDKTLKKE